MPGAWPQRSRQHLHCTSTGVRSGNSRRRGGVATAPLRQTGGLRLCDARASVLLVLLGPTTRLAQRCLGITVRGRVVDPRKTESQSGAIAGPCSSLALVVSSSLALLRGEEILRCPAVTRPPLSPGDHRPNLAALLTRFADTVQSVSHAAGAPSRPTHENTNSLRQPACHACCSLAKN
jgi:hypothetical protein